MDTPHIILAIASFTVSFLIQFRGFKFKLPRFSRSAQTGYAAHDDDDLFQESTPMFNVDGTMMMGDFDTNGNMYGCVIFD